jgi:hypothetical protein
MRPNSDEDRRIRVLMVALGAAPYDLAFALALVPSEISDPVGG